MFTAQVLSLIYRMKSCLHVSSLSHIWQFWAITQSCFIDSSSVKLQHHPHIHKPQVNHILTSLRGYIQLHVTVTEKMPKSSMFALSICILNPQSSREPERFRACSPPDSFSPAWSFNWDPKEFVGGD